VCRREIVVEESGGGRGPALAGEDAINLQKNRGLEQRLLSIILPRCGRKSASGPGEPRAATGLKKMNVFVY